MLIPYSDNDEYNIHNQNFFKNELDISQNLRNCFIIEKWL